MTLLPQYRAGLLVSAEQTDGLPHSDQVYLSCAYKGMTFFITIWGSTSVQCRVNWRSATHSAKLYLSCGYKGMTFLTTIPRRIAGQCRVNWRSATQCWGVPLVCGQGNDILYHNTGQCSCSVQNELTVCHTVLSCTTREWYSLPQYHAWLWVSSIVKLTTIICWALPCIYGLYLCFQLSTVDIF